MIFDHPFFAVTGPDGSFELRGVPPGSQNVVVWQEKVGYVTPGMARGMPVNVAAGEVVNLREIKIDPAKVKNGNSSRVVRSRPARLSSSANAAAIGDDPRSVSVFPRVTGPELHGTLSGRPFAPVFGASDSALRHRLGAGRRSWTRSIHAHRRGGSRAFLRGLPDPASFVSGCRMSARPLRDLRIF